MEWMGVSESTLCHPDRPSSTAVPHPSVWIALPKVNGTVLCA
jgi:hypothetical protein